MKEYLILTDREHSGIIIKTEGEDWFRYYNERGWVETGILLKYLNDESPLYDCYEKISEEEVGKLIAEFHDKNTEEFLDKRVGKLEEHE